MKKENSVLLGGLGIEGNGIECEIMENFEELIHETVECIEKF